MTANSQMTATVHKKLSAIKSKKKFIYVYKYIYK